MLKSLRSLRDVDVDVPANGWAILSFILLLTAAMGYADVYDKGSGVTTNDALAIQEFLLGKVKELPVAAAK